MHQSVQRGFYSLQELQYDAEIEQKADFLPKLFE